MEPRRRLDVNTGLFPTAPATNLMPDVLLCFPLELISKVERGTLMSGQLRVSIAFAQFLRPERTLRCC